MPPFAHWCVWKEIIGILLAISTFADLLYDRKVVLYSDNKGMAMHDRSSCTLRFVVAGAEHTTAKGSARAFDQNALVHEIWALAFEHRIHLWVERVASEYNISDSPSRRKYAIMHDVYAKWRQPVLGQLLIAAH